MKLPDHKIKIICTIGPASRSLPMLQDLIKSGMNVARLNFSHAGTAEHQENIRNIYKAAKKLDRRVAILVDLPGAKMRVGKLSSEPLELTKGQQVTLTTEEVSGTALLIPVEYKQLAASVSKGSNIFLNDGFIQLRVKEISGNDIVCHVVIGGTLLSHKGINLPGAKLFVEPITDKDLEFIKFGLNEGVSTFGLSFIEKAADINKVREFAKKIGRTVYLVAKIERRAAIKNFDEILKAADAIMIARGDLGVEIPLEEVPAIQKKLIRKANVMGRPVITATQMLESMTHNTRPTRAEVTDVANAILDGTDAIMLSEETAIGTYPVETVKMMAKIATFTEHQRNIRELSNDACQEVTNAVRQKTLTIPDMVSLNVSESAEELSARYILAPTLSGGTARRISRFKPRCWILSYSTQKETCDFLAFSYGVYPFLMKEKSSNWYADIIKMIRNHGLVKTGDPVIFTERRFSEKPGGTDSLGIVTIEKEEEDESKS